jgi:hypothetical protein
MRINTEVEPYDDGFRVFVNDWGLGTTFPTEEAAQFAADAIEQAASGDLKPMRYAFVSAEAGRQDQIAAYLPGNYRIAGRTAIRGSNTVQFLIAGRDVAGWTLDDYVIPRLASGLYFTEEIA